MSYHVARALRWNARRAAGIILVAASPYLGAQGLTFEQAIALAGTRAPSLAVRQAAVDSAAAASISAGELPDPRLIVGFENYPIDGPDRFSVTREPMTMGRVGVMQDVPNAAKRRARIETANARTTRERAQLALERVAVQRDAATAWIARYTLEQRLAALNALDAEIGVAQQTINAEIASGKRQPADALMIRQDTTLVAERRDELLRDIAKSTATLRRLIGPAANERLAGDLPRLGPDAHGLHDRLDRHLELLATAADIDVARGELHEAQAATRPDWGWEVGYQKRASAFGDMVSVQVRIDLPLLQARRQEPQILSRQKEVTRLEAELENMRARHVEELDQMLAERDELVRRVERLRNVTTGLAEQRMQLQLASYGAGKGDLAAVLSARKDVIETRLKTLEAQAQLASTEAKLAYFIAEEKP